jgi:anti-sigma B factor antagonist
MHITEKKNNDIFIYTVQGDIDINSSPDIRKAFEKSTNAKAPYIVINLRDVSYIDSSGLATLVEMLKKTRGYGGKLKLTNLAPKVKSLFEITKLEKLFEIYETEEEACASPA